MESAPTRKRKSSLDEKSLDAFLNFLDEDRQRAGERYERIRQKLLSFFRGRGCYWNDEKLADDTIDRVIRRIEGGEEVRDLMAFILAFARRVASEHFGRKEQCKSVPMDEIGELAQPTDVKVDDLEVDRRLHCIEKCMPLLRLKDRDLILQWHQYDKAEKIENRQRLATSRGISVDTLRTQACRAHQRLRELVCECLADSDTV